MLLLCIPVDKSIDAILKYPAVHLNQICCWRNPHFQANGSTVGAVNSLELLDLELSGNVSSITSDLAPGASLSHLNIKPPFG